MPSPCSIFPVRESPLLLAGGILFVQKMSIARAHSRYEDFRGLITGEGEVGRIGRLRIEGPLRQQARMSVVGRAAVSKVPFAGNNHCKPTIAMGMRCNARMRRYLELHGIRASLRRIAGQHNCLNS